VSLGAICTPLNAWWTGPELEYGLIDSGSKVLVADAQSALRLQEHLPNCPDLKWVYVSRAVDEIAHPNVIKLDEVIGGADGWASLPDDDLPAADVGPEDPATIFYTSG